MGVLQTTLENMTLLAGLWEYNHEQTKGSPPANSEWIRGLGMRESKQQDSKLQ